MSLVRILQECRCIDACESDGETVLSTRVVICRKKKDTDLYFTLYQSYLA